MPVRLADRYVLESPSESRLGSVLGAAGRGSGSRRELEGCISTILMSDHCHAGGRTGSSIADIAEVVELTRLVVERSLVSLIAQVDDRQVPRTIAVLR